MRKTGIRNRLILKLVGNRPVLINMDVCLKSKGPIINMSCDGDGFIRPRFRDDEGLIANSLFYAKERRDLTVDSIEDRVSRLDAEGY